MNKIRRKTLSELFTQANETLKTNAEDIEYLQSLEVVLKKVKSLAARNETRISNLNKIQDTASDLSSDEQGAFEALPESLQDTDRAQDMESNAEKLSDVVSDIDDILSSLDGLYTDLMADLSALQSV